MDFNFGLIMIGLSYMLLIIFFRTWTLQKSNYRFLLFIAIGLALTGNILGFFIYKTGTFFGVLNGPVTSLLIYKLLYDWFNRKYSKPPASPFATFWNMDKKLMKDGVLNAVFVFFSIILTAAGGLLTHGV